ncbi:regulation of response to stimulus [Sparganum proliferum]
MLERGHPSVLVATLLSALSATIRRYANMEKSSVQALIVHPHDVAVPSHLHLHKHGLTTDDADSFSGILSCHFTSSLLRRQLRFVIVCVEVVLIPSQRYFHCPRTPASLHQTFGLMLLNCKAQISDWTSACPVRQRAKETQLSILKRSNEVFLCLTGKIDKSQWLFKLTGHNILKLFTKFLEEGKLTVRFSDPRRDVCLSNLSSAAAGNLAALLKRISQGNGVPDGILRSLNNPASLWPSICEKSPLAGSLRNLDLANNQIVWLPEDFWNLSNLTNLDISNNKLRGLPAANLHRHTGVVNLELSRNQLSCLPHAFSRLRRLMRVVLDGNPWHPPTLDLDTLQLPQSPDSLLHLASDAFIRHVHKPLPLLQQLPLALALRLAILRNCRVCGRLCGFLPMRFLRKFTPSCLERVVDTTGPTIISYCCSRACLCRLKAHPFRYL